MGYYSDGIIVKSTFSPNDSMTRAEVGVVLSRMLRGTSYADTEEQRYQKHLEALRKAGIMKTISNPMRKELRGTTLLMFQRMKNYLGT
jgi:hypothetical protein